MTSKAVIFGITLVSGRSGVLWFPSQGISMGFLKVSHGFFLVSANSRPCPCHNNIQYHIHRRLSGSIFLDFHRKCCLWTPLLSLFMSVILDIVWSATGAIVWIYQVINIWNIWRGGISCWVNVLLLVCYRLRRSDCIGGTPVCLVFLFGNQQCWVFPLSKMSLFLWWVVFSGNGYTIYRC